jgi:hypothetical protein
MAVRAPFLLRSVALAPSMDMIPPMDRQEDPEFLKMVEDLAAHPEHAKVIRGYPYRVASLRADASVNLDKLQGLWQHLSDAAGWDRRNNHSVFVFEYGGQRHAVMFSDFSAYFGTEESVFKRQYG